MKLVSILNYMFLLLLKQIQLKRSFLFVIGLVFTLMLYYFIPSLAKPDQPFGQHCIDVGPPTSIPAGEDWCGCSWGVVFFEGKPQLGAKITILHHKSKEQWTTETIVYTDPIPFYSIKASELGAIYGDAATFTVSFMGQSVTRIVSLIPQTISGTNSLLPVQEWEQEINFAFPATNAPSDSLPTVTSLGIMQNTISDTTFIHFTAIATMTKPVTNTRIVAYEWQSDRDGMLGTQANFAFRNNKLSSGDHLISVRAQDAHGRWSSPLTTHLTIEKPNEPIYIPRQYLVYLNR